MTVYRYSFRCAFLNVSLELTSHDTCSPMPAEPTRKKSCASCRLAKARCNLATPKCSRCELRRAECAYERNIYVQAGSGSNGSNQATGRSFCTGTRITVNDSTAPSVRAISLLPTEALIERSDTFSQGTVLHDPQRIALDAPPGRCVETSIENGLDLDWNLELHSWAADPSMVEDDQSATVFEDLDSVLDCSTGVKDPRMTYLPSRQPHVPNLHPSSSDVDSQHQGQGSPFPPSMPLHRLPSESQALIQNSPRLLMSIPAPSLPGLFLPRKFATSSSSFTAKYLMAVLCSYPKFMTNGSILPPYIHPVISNYEGDNCMCCEPRTHLPESLAICSSIVQMFLTKTSESHAFIWGTIHLEQQRLYKEVCTVDLMVSRKLLIRDTNY